MSSDNEASLIEYARVLALVNAAKDRYAFVKMIDKLYISGLQVSSFVRFMQACVAVDPEDREAFVGCMEPLLLALLQYVDRDQYCGEYEALLSCIANEEPHNRQYLVEAIQPFVHRIPSEEFISFAFSFVHSLNAAVYISASQLMQALLRDDLERDDCCLILHTAVEHYDYIAKKKDFIKCVQKLFLPLPSEDYAYAVMAALKIKPAHFHKFMTQLAPSYSVVDQQGNSRNWFLPSLCLSKKKYQASFVSCVESLLTADMMKNGHYKIAEIIASVDTELWHDLGSLAQRVYTFCPALNGENREWILHVLSRFDDI